MSALPVAVPPLVHGPGFWKRAFASRSFAIGTVLSVLLAVAAALSFAWTPYSVYEIGMANSQQTTTQHSKKKENILRVTENKNAKPANQSAIMMTAVFGPGMVNA